MKERVDSNHNDIVKALRGVGAEVQSMASIGKGCADLLVAFRKIWYVAEVKDGSKPPSARKLTDDELKWHQRFNPKADVHIWNSVDDALRTIGITSSQSQKTSLD